MLSIFEIYNGDPVVPYQKFSVPETDIIFCVLGDGCTFNVEQNNIVNEEITKTLQSEFYGRQRNRDTLIKIGKQIQELAKICS